MTSPWKPTSPERLTLPCAEAAVRAFAAWMLIVFARSRVPGALLAPSQAPEIVTEAMEAVPFSPAALRLDGLGSFGNLYWAGLSDNGTLSAYVKKLRAALAARSIPYDRKRFSPHITLVRNAVFEGEAAWPQLDPPQGETEARGVSLMRSERGKHGMIYTEIGWIGGE